MIPFWYSWYVCFIYSLVCDFSLMRHPSVFAMSESNQEKFPKLYSLNAIWIFSGQTEQSHPQLTFPHILQVRMNKSNACVCNHYPSGLHLAIFGWKSEWAYWCCVLDLTEVHHQREENRSPFVSMLPNQAVPSFWFGIWIK